MRRTLFGLAFLIAVSTSISVRAQALRIDSVVPQRVERGRNAVLTGSFGDPEAGKVIRIARVIDRRTEVFYPTIVDWTRTEVEISIPTDVPLDTFYVTVVYPDRPTRHSNNAILVVRRPAPPAMAARSDDPVVVLPNHCVGRPPRRRNSSDSNTERSTGAINAPCESMRTIYEENDLRSFPGGEISIRGDFGDRRSDQHVALARQDGEKLTVAHVLQIISWSTTRVRIRIGDQVRPDHYRLLILNRLSRSVVPGVFEQGSNDIEIRIEN